jgi:uncharacterized DUF497 family protein
MTEKPSAYDPAAALVNNTMEGRLMVVVFCIPEPEQVHIISFRKGNKREQKFFK